MTINSEDSDSQLMKNQTDKGSLKIFWRVVAIVFIGILIIGIIPSILMLVIPAFGPEELPTPWSGAFFHTIMLIFSFIFIGLFSRWKFKGYGFQIPRSYRMTRVIISGLLFGALATVLLALLPGEGKENLPGQDMSLIQVILFIWLYASLAEELLCRGLIQGYLNSFSDRGFTFFGLKLSLPVVTGALFFALMHLALLTTGVSLLPVVIIVSFALLLGLMAGYQIEHSGSLIPAVLVHIIFNVGGTVAELALRL